MVEAGCLRLLACAGSCPSLAPCLLGGKLSSHSFTAIRLHRGERKQVEGGGF